MKKSLRLHSMALLLFAAFTGVRVLCGRVEELESAAMTLLAAPAHGGTFRDVNVTLAGEEATLAGTLARKEEQALAGGNHARAGAHGTREPMGGTQEVADYSSMRAVLGIEIAYMRFRPPP